MYAVSIGDDGMFSAEYVVPPALSIPLGSSGSAVDVVQNENGTFSALINGEYQVITADTMVTAENGNVYRATLSPEGIPIGVMHVAAMQDVMLGALGGTITLTQAEDMSWWYGEAAVASGYVHTAANGNMYMLTMDAEGMWSAMYQQVEVTVDLGTQGAITLVRAEDMSWWYGTEGVDVGSEVMSANGNTYTLWYTDGVWSTRFEPESMEIEGTGLVAMTRESDDMYDVSGEMLAASGVGDITVDGAMYHVWMHDGALMGSRYDAKQKDGRYNIAVGNPVLSVQDDPVVLAAQGIEDETTAANELQTHLIIRGEAFSLGALLGTGQASRVGAGHSTMVSDALGEIRDLRQKAVATLDVFDTGDAGLSSSLTRLWTSVQGQVTGIFGDKVTLPTNRRDERILDDFDDIIDALSDADAFAAATADGGGGVFEDAELSAADAATAFDAEKVEAMATFGALGNTRFGAFWKKERGDATSKLADPAANALGAFAYGTTAALKTLRTRHVRQGTGNAFYAGRTEAVDGKGNFFSGDIEIQVRFAAERVNAVITNLAGATGAWEYLYGNTDVAEIILPDTRLAGNASWNGSGDNATVVYSTRAGVPRPLDAPYSFQGQLLGRAAGDQGNEASGVWSLGNSGDGTNYLAGGFGVMRGADLPDIRPEPDAGEGSQTTILPDKNILRDPTETEITTAGQRDTDGDGTDDAVHRTNLAGVTGVDPFWDTDNPDTRGQTIADGMLTVTGREYDEADAVIGDIDDTTKTPAATVNHLVNDAKYRTHKIDLAAALDGGLKWANGDKHVDLAKAAIEKQLRILESDIGLSEDVKSTAWDAVKSAILNNLFTEMAFTASKGSSFVADYSASRNDDFVRAAAEALEALQSNGALKSALGDGGVFHGLSGDAQANVDKLWGRRNSRLQYAVGSTDFTRFGAWRRVTSKDAETADTAKTDAANGDGPNSLAYSQLAKTAYQSVNDPRYPKEARMTYEGSTIAVVGTKFFEGSVDVEVLWNADSVGGTINMSISDLENMSDASPLYLDTNTGVHEVTDVDNDGTIDGILEEVVSIDIANIGVDPELAVSTGATSTVSVMSVQAGQVATRTTPWITAGNATAETVMGQFVGQGVSGPLAVLGTWEMTNSDGSSAAIGAKVTGQNAAKDAVNRQGVTGATFTDSDTVTDGTFAAVPINGGFGAELP